MEEVGPLYSSEKSCTGGEILGKSADSFSVRSLGLSVRGPKEGVKRGKKKCSWREEERGRSLFSFVQDEDVDGVPELYHYPPGGGGGGGEGGRAVAVEPKASTRKG